MIVVELETPYAPLPLVLPQFVHVWLALSVPYGVIPVHTFTLAP